MKRIALIAVVASAVVILSAVPAEAQCGRRAWQYTGSQWRTYRTSWQSSPQAAYVSVIPATPAMTARETSPPTVDATYATAEGDAYGFTAWINNVRARYGLRALVWSADAAAHAAINSAQGFGHSYLGGTRRQNVGVGQLQTVEAMWLQSPGHFEAIVDPYVSEVGLAYVNGVWTMNAR